MILKCINRLIYDDVIDNTFGVMLQLSKALEAQTVHGLSGPEKSRLKDSLLLLCSESIREALHKYELPITNGIIRKKNALLTQLGVVIPEGHHEIDPAKYPHHW